MKPHEVKKLGDDEIDIEVASLRRRLFDLRCQMVTEKIQNTAQFGHVKRDIARLLTEKRSRQVTAAQDA
ncbi:MAG: 50S ribosomal protein L29 [Phycisphaerales bacterium]|jgi:ribosomal protein L29|nr:50S ribosomal protein L29 [Phycisphaerales bacterium]MDP6311211.1 50S ribosomal protein L29 [Phycisphaerales bacterium]MDP7086370.1 50S ribosomal protein L29 [Phycisphaerales bacterium]MDP7189344.1 50S ribosomal protein L29 [Phycisphaerales bacterium]MDP7519980.1 50S ribosomal protein L29 [Phycisphaerales bacterium]|tara:strand:+ start:791 stop:997 length:207 start_codon:yes stop_codon:yes gene_type:complete